MIRRPIHPLPKRLTFWLSETTKKLYIRTYAHIFMYGIFLILLVYINDTRYAKKPPPPPQHMYYSHSTAGVIIFPNEASCIKKSTPKIQFYPYRSKTVLYL